jgi:hypothetical protein
VLLLGGAAFAQAEDAEGKAETAKERFFEARKVLLRGDAATAAELFRTLTRVAPDSDYADDCLYWTGRCYLRQKDREPDAVVAFLRLLREHPESPWLDDAARELARLGDRTIVPELASRLEGGGAKAEQAARALAEFGEEAGVEWLARHTGEKVEVAKERPAASPATKKDDEVAALRREVARLKAELEEALALLKQLLEEKKAGADGAGEDGR